MHQTCVSHRGHMCKALSNCLYEGMTRLIQNLNQLLFQPCSLLQRLTHDSGQTGPILENKRTAHCNFGMGLQLLSNLQRETVHCKKNTNTAGVYKAKHSTCASQHQQSACGQEVPCASQVLLGNDALLWPPALMGRSRYIAVISY